MTLLEKIDLCKINFLKEKSALDTSPSSIDLLKIKYLSRKGEVARLFSSLNSVSNEDKPSLGKALNKLKLSILQNITDLEDSLDGPSIVDDNDIDYTLPGNPYYNGSVHPINQLIDEIKDIFLKIGFSIASGKEVDTDFFNLEALNIPEYHPARDMQDTFYLKNDMLLRTHTSASQIHYMLENNPPVRIISPGKVYRNEDISVRSYCLFHQIEGLFIDKNVSFSELKGTLDYFAKQIFGNSVKTRFRPSYFPFTEPSAEMDIYWGLKSESDYRITKGTGWLEVLGCGMVNPEVFKSVQYDADVWRGYAFGLGIERLAMLKYGIEDIRIFFDGDIRFLEQFK